MARIVQVTGDIVLDWNIARVNGTSGPRRVWNPADVVRAYRSYGGARLTADLLGGLYPWPGEGWAIETPRLPDVDAPEAIQEFHRSYAMWSPHPWQSGENEKEQVWRVDDFLGLHRLDDLSRYGSYLRSEADTAGEGVELVVLDDADLGFRDARDLWPRAVTDANHAAWIVVKMAGDVAAGELWHHLVSSCAHRLVVVLDVNDLRRREVTVSRELSWERTAEDLYWELTHNPRVNALSCCRHVVVSLGASGALLLSRAGEDGSVPCQGTAAREGSASDGAAGCAHPTRCSLYFDSRGSEGMWEERRPGRLIGYTTCLAAGVAGEIMLAPESPDMRRAVQSGIAAMRRLHEGGYGRYTPTAPLPRLESPIEELADTIRQRPDVGLRAGGGRRGPSDVAEAIKTLSWAQVPEPRRPMLVRSRVERRRPLTGLWSVLNDKCCDEGCEGLGSQLEAARAIVRIGADEALPGVPLAKFGGLRTADRSEIEGYQSIRALIGTYGSGKDATPLSIAVFGPPGSGKSYGVEQVAASITGLQVESVTFNLSQFSSPDQIASALHAVRDVGLKGKLPLVFWDEFDATFEDRRLGWLRYFLSPMQDGAFQEQQVTHHIGRAIFVFAGGIYSTMESFAEGEGMTNDEFRAVKGPDFKSRLRGYVNIMGPNPVGNDPRRDRYHLVRRAILLRSLLERKARQVFGRPGQPHLAQIDEGVLEALLQISRYEHGARSMGAIIEMSTLTGHASFERSCLPSQAQLDAHVSGASFMEIVQQSQQQPYLGVGLLDDLAEAVYRRYCQDNGLVDAHGHPTEPWADLGEPEKESNRASVRDYQHKLATIGYVMVRQQAGQSPFTLTDAELRVLARLEHERWMDAKLAKGYVWGPDKNDDAPLPLTNPLLLPWRKLSPADQANNVKLVEAIPQLLGAQDYTCKCLRPEALAGMLGLHAEEEQEVRIAVAGHRMLAELEKITDGIANALREIGERYPNKRMVAYSPLVAGGVAMLSRAILDHPGASLIAVLPMRQEDFARDFADGEELETFQWLLGLASDVVSLPLAPSRIDAYRAGDEYIVDQSDVLITIWDGNPSQGPAGSAESFNRAMQQKMPMFHIQAGNRMPGTHEPTTLGVLQGKLVTYNLP